MSQLYYFEQVKLQRHSVKSSFSLCPPQIIALVMVSIGVYARMMKHAGE